MYLLFPNHFPSLSLSPYHLSMVSKNCQIWANNLCYWGYVTDTRNRYKIRTVEKNLVVVWRESNQINAIRLKILTLFNVWLINELIIDMQFQKSFEIFNYNRDIRFKYIYNAWINYNNCCTPQMYYCYHQCKVETLVLKYCSHVHSFRFMILSAPDTHCLIILIIAIFSLDVTNSNWS